MQSQVTIDAAPPVFTVLFVDYGNQQTTPASDLVSSPPPPPPSLAPATALPPVPLPPAPLPLEALDRAIEEAARPGRVALPPPPPPLQVSQAEQRARAMSRIEEAAAVLGVAPAQLQVEDDEEKSLLAAAVSKGPFFGVELRELRARDGTAVPQVLHLAAAELKRRAHVEGIFRIPGRANNVASLVSRADACEPIDFVKAETPEIASFLKKFFALLPASVIPADLVDQFGKTYPDSRMLCKELKQLIDQALPVERAEVLAFSLELLNFIALRSDQNKMTSKNLATVFLPALFFSVQGDATSPEEIMKMAVLGKSVSQTLSFMIDNPHLDPNTIVEEKSALTVAVGGGANNSAGGGGGGGGGGGSNSGSPTQQVIPIPISNGKPGRTSSFTKSPGNSPVVSLKKGSRRRSNTMPEKDMLLATSPDGKLSAETVLAAMRKSKDKMVRRAGSFQFGDGSFFVGRRGWLTVAKKPLWFLIVNDWLYWFKEEQNLSSTTPSALAALLSNFMGHVLMARCNVISRRQRELEVIQPTGATTVLLAETQKECEEWLMSLAEVAIVGFPLPLRLPAEADRVVKADWLTAKDGERMFATLSETALVLSRDPKATDVIKTIALEHATVAKGKKSDGMAGFVMSDCNEKLVFGLHNTGVAQEWVDAIKSCIVIAYASKFEPSSLASLRGPKKLSSSSM